MIITTLQSVSQTQSLIIGASALAVYALFFFLGRKTNRSKAKQYALAIDPFAKREYASVGVSNEALIFQDSPQYFYHYASGRKQVPVMCTELKLSPRHCVLSSLTGVLFPTKDSATVQFALETNVSPSVAFAVIRKSFEKRFREMFPLFCSIATSQIKDSTINDQFVVFCDVPALGQNILTFVEFFGLADSSLSLLQYCLFIETTSFEAPHLASFGDVKALSQMGIKLPLNESNFNDISGLYQSMMILGDRIASSKPTSSVLSLMENKRRQARREEVQEAKKKREELEKKLKEEKEKEQERKLRSMPPELELKERERLRRLREKREERKRGKGGVQRLVVG
ncbi:hypothetical protein P9112_009390 [Eukaryota sp. TZLM1-RC]